MAASCRMWRHIFSEKSSNENRTPSCEKHSDEGEGGGFVYFSRFRPLISSAQKHGVFQHRSEATLLHKTPCGFYPSMHRASRRSVTFFHPFLSVFQRFRRIGPAVVRFSSAVKICVSMPSACFGIMAEGLWKLRLHNCHEWYIFFKILKNI